MALTGETRADAVYADGRRPRDIRPIVEESLAYFGTLVKIRSGLGPVEPMPPAALGGRSNSLSRPVVFHFVRDPRLPQRRWPPSPSRLLPPECCVGATVLLSVT